MSHSQKPTLVLIPGSFLPSTHYTPLLPHLPPGTKTHILDPPSYHTPKPGLLPTMADDASFIASFITELADAGEEVVLVAHSYGGMPASECLRGLSVEARRGEGKQGGVRGVGFVSAVVPREGEGMEGTMVGGVRVPLEADENGWLFHPSPADTQAVCLNTTPAPAAAATMKDLNQHSSAAFTSSLTYPGYKDVPVSWFLCEQDLCVIPAVQEEAIRVIEESWKGTSREGEKVKVKRVGCDHFPTVSARDELVGWLAGLLE